ncbi:leucine-rich repeat domain-containing protein [Gimesia chilikensis]|uniref:leucine-rich repeat domain-containing protein n=1 Tax=Gimesia chilikensis TaxID=2605989 RepID=UPI003A92D5C4
MKPIREAMILVYCLTLINGCAKQGEVEKPASQETAQTEQATQETPETSVPESELKAAESLKAAGAKLKLDKDGYVIEVNLRGTVIDDAKTLEAITQLTRLRSLLFNETPLNDAVLELVGQVKSLENLDARDCSLTNKSITYLTGLSKLKALRLSGNEDIDDEAMPNINKLTNLKALMLDFLWVSDDGLTQLKDLQKLEEIYLAKTLIDDKALQTLTTFPKLKKIRLAQNQISNEGLAALAKIPQLVELDLSENSLLSDPGMQHLSGLKEMQKLNLWRVALTDEGIKPLQGLTKMKWLNLDNTQVTDAGLKYLKDMHQLEFLHLGSTPVSDAGLPALEGLTSLKELTVTRTAVSEAGVQELKKKLPNTKIQLKYIPGE